MSKQKFQNKYRIPSARAWWHDYNGGLYFITICTAGMDHYFGHITNGEMCLNTLGVFVEENILNLTNHYPYAEISTHQVMPNHLHLIVLVNGDMAQGLDRLDGSQDSRVETGRAPSLQENPEYQEKTTENGQQKPEQNNQPVNEIMQLISQRKGLLSVAMGGLKSATTRFANDNKITFGWQARFHDHIIRNQDEYDRIVAYIENNPMTWEQDRFCTGETTVNN